MDKIKIIKIPKVSKDEKLDYSYTAEGMSTSIAL